jgi:hypothetical protein
MWPVDGEKIAVFQAVSAEVVGESGQVAPFIFDY